MEEQDYKKIIEIIQDTIETDIKETEILKKKYEEKFGRLYKRNKELCRKKHTCQQRN